MEATIGKRSDFEKAPRSWYPTPEAAVAPLLPHLRPNRRYAEPCAGDGALISHLGAAGHECVWASDIHPLADGIVQADALEPGFKVPSVDLCITNPPWDRPILHRLIPVFVQIAPTWLLLDADWLHTKQSGPFLPMLRKIVSVGRVKWIEGSSSTGKDNCAWMLFGPPTNFPAEFFGRTSNTTEGSFRPAR
jgi:hypothetical protein